MRRNRFSTASRVMVQLAFSGGYSIAFLWGVHGIYTGTVTFGMMTAFLQLVGQIQRPLMEMGRQLPSLIHTTTSIDRLKELETDSMATAPASFSLPGKLGIRFRNVSFHYPGASRYILRWFSHDFRPGSSTAILGETGAGKTTIFRLILSLLRPTEGHILLYNGTTSCWVIPKRQNPNCVKSWKWPPQSSCSAWRKAWTHSVASREAGSAKVRHNV